MRSNLHNNTKTLFITCFLFFNLAAFSQPLVIQGTVVDSTGYGYARDAEIRLVKSDTVFHADALGRFRFYLRGNSDTMIVSSGSLGCDTLLILRNGHTFTVRALYTDSLVYPRAADYYNNFSIKLPGSCKDLPVTDVCPKCHSNANVLKIIYGFPNKEAIKKADAGLIWLGGCMIDDCSPHYHCKTDNIDF